MSINLISMTDSYKFSHYNQYPESTQQVFSYMEARGITSKALGLPESTEVKEMVFYGLKDYLDLLAHGVNWDNIINVAKVCEVHGVPFNREGWHKLAHKHNGKLPLEIRALPEGSIVPVGTPLLTITNTDDEFPWLVGWFETLLMKIWYPTTVATKSYYVKKILKEFWGKTSDTPGGVDFAYHNFGDRGSTCVAAAVCGGAAHLTQFKGTDNFGSLQYIQDVYGDGPEGLGYSIPASEHSTVTSWGKQREFQMIEKYLETYKDSPIIACVLDSYDIYRAVKFVARELRPKIESDDYPIFVIRPDSGDPKSIIRSILFELEVQGVRSSTNSRGYIVFDKYRIIWGDGITPKVIAEILDMTTRLGYAADNFAFGSGGDLMQNVNRDTLKFAIKCSAVKVNGEWRDVYKDPITDKGKASKRGVINPPQLETVFLNGRVMINPSFAEIRQRCLT
jgi:nicotinamide phosphoribosyltransferase